MPQEFLRGFSLNFLGSASFARDKRAMHDKISFERIKKEWREKRKLAEHERRRWAATEAQKIGRGGIALVARATKMARDTIRAGLADVQTPELQRLQGRITLATMNLTQSWPRNG